MTDDMRKDIKCWYLFLGTSILWLMDTVEVDSEMAVDACLVAAGGVSRNEYYRIKFPQKVLSQQVQITHLELLAVIIGTRVWGDQLRGKILKVSSDNEAVACIINAGTSRDHLLQKLLRELIWWLAIYEWKVKSVHLMGSLN